MQRKWTNEDKQQLEQLVETYTINSRTNWEQVAAGMDGRSANQCKQQFRSVLQLSRNVNHVWNDDETFELFIYILFYGKKWRFIQKNYFPQCTSDQLRQRCNFMLLKKQEFRQLYERLIKGDAVVLDKK